VISLREVSAASGSKNANISAAADLYVSGLRLEGGRANVNLKQVPFLLAGVSQAKLSGSASLTLEREGERMKVLVSLPELEADLPRSSGHSVLPVSAHPDIEIIQPLAEPSEASSGESFVWELVFDLGDKVRVKRADLEIPLRGSPIVTLGDEVAVRGDVELRAGGRVTLLGKGFTIESGEVHFDTGDATNPHVRVLASWRAPDATTVYVEVRGTLNDATLRLESDPPLSEPEIQALLLGGASGISTDFLSEALVDTPFRGMQFGASNQTAADERTYATYWAAVQISDEIWFEGSYKSLEAGGPGDQGANGVSGTIDWRFRNNWSLRSEIGNMGTGLDLLWQYHY
jgi:autotransporter translocation and assembly factor TamB